MKITKRNSYLSILNDYLIDSPAPVNINYFYNFGSLLGLNFIILLITGITLAMHYTSNINLAFSSVEHITREVNYGYFLRYIHANTVSTFFICVYLHILRGLFYGSYRSPRNTLWIIGVFIFLAMMATAFIGYVLPYGQMSLWGATVITNFFSVIPWLGPEIVLLLWGGFSVSNPTLSRFFAFHYLLPFILALLIVLHLIALHQNASNNPVGITSRYDRIRFHPYFTSKDVITFMLFFMLLIILVSFYPNYLGHPDNSIPANPLVTPIAIVPEWYFLPFYAILRAIPSKLGGVCAMIGAILILIPISLLAPRNPRSLKYRPLLHILTWMFVANFMLLLWLGNKHIDAPYILMGQISALLYFMYFILLCFV